MTVTYFMGNKWQGRIIMQQDSLINADMIHSDSQSKFLIPNTRKQRIKNRDNSSYIRIYKLLLKGVQHVKWYKNIFISFDIESRNYLVDGFPQPKFIIGVAIFVRQ